MSKYITRALVLMPTAALLFGLVAHQDSDTARAVTRNQAVTVVPAATVSAASTPKRLRSLNYALKQKGDPYRYGATGPSSWDCSGLPYVAYKRVGLPIPRITGDMLDDRRDVFYRTNHPRKGDLAFFGRGHVEYYISGTKYNGTTYGAHKSGTRVGYRKYNEYYHPTVFLHRRGSN